MDVLFVDDDRVTRDVVGCLLRERGHSVTLAPDGTTAMNRIGSRIFDMVITDVRLPGVDGFEIFRHLQRESPQTNVVIITAFASIGEAVEAIREQAVDYIPKPFEPERLIQVVDRIAEHRRLKAERDEALALLTAMNTQVTLLGQSPAMVSLRDRIDTIAHSDCPILLTGDSGTGKELVARTIHSRDGGKNRPFVAVNCAAFPETLLEAELFGHEKGAFTGAHQRREGRFKAADGGTLFLDEVGEMSLPFQAKLLRVLQEGTFEPVGTNKTIQVHVRIISATNRDIKRLVAEGRFREDLYYRIKLFHLHIPPLRERRGDLAILVESFLRKFSQPGRRHPVLSSRVWAAMTQYAFPGNIRELEHVIRHALILSGDGTIDMDHLPDEIRGNTLPPGAAPAPQSLDAAWQQFEREYILRTLEATNWNRTHAAQVLGISRKTLWAKLSSYGIGAPDDEAHAD